MKSNRHNKIGQNCVLLICSLMTVLSLAACSTVAHKAATAKEAKERPGIEQRWGVKVSGLRLSAAGYLLDFRYQVTDPEKASFLADRQIKPYLLDQASGAKVFVPSPPKVGPMRQTGVKPVVNRTYFVLFANPGRFIKQGNKVSVVMGDFKAEDLTVE